MCGARSRGYHDQERVVGWRRLRIALDVRLHRRRDSRELIKHLVRMRVTNAESRITHAGCRIRRRDGNQARFDAGADEMRNQAGGQRHSVFELFVEFRRRSRFFLDAGVENYGDAPVVVAREFPHHDLRGLGGRLPIDLAPVVARNIPPDRVKVAPAPLCAALDPSQQRRQRVAEFVYRQRRWVNDYLSARIQTASLFDEAEREPAMNYEALDQVDSAFWEAAFDSGARRSAG